jgi:hypothetical protein
MNLCNATLFARSLPLVLALVGFQACAKDTTDSNRPDDNAGMGGTAGSGGKGTGGEGNAGGGAGGTTPAAKAPTWTEVYAIIGGCAGAQCHTSDVSGKLIMGTQQATYDVLVNVDAMGENQFDITTGMKMAGPDCKDSGLKRIAPGDAKKSLLVQKIGENPPCGQRMPIGQPLTDAQIKTISSWVEAGAKND